MRRHLALLVVAVVAVLVSVFVGGATTARATSARAASTSCKANTPYEDGYTHASQTPSSAWAVVVYNSTSVRNSGSIRNFLEVSDPYDESNNLVIGILNTGDGPQLYIENSGQFISGSKVGVSKDTGYTVELIHDSSSNTSSTWTAEWIDGVYNYQYTTTIYYSDPPIVFLMHSETTNSTCNVVSSAFKSMSYSISSLGKDSDFAGMYAIKDTSTTSFTVNGPTH